MPDIARRLVFATFGALCLSGAVAWFTRALDCGCGCDDDDQAVPDGQ